MFLNCVPSRIVEATFAVTPMETVKTKLIQRNMKMVEGIKTIIKEEGIGGIYQVGYIFRLCLLVFYIALILLCYVLYVGSFCDDFETVLKPRTTIHVLQ